MNVRTVLVVMTSKMKISILSEVHSCDVISSNDEADSTRIDSIKDSDPS